MMLMMTSAVKMQTHATVLSWGKKWQQKEPQTCLCARGRKM
jgi:hypothetical protein